MSPQSIATNDTLYPIHDQESNLSNEEIETILGRAKRRGRGKALKTLLLEESEKAEKGTKTEPKHGGANSSSDEDREDMRESTDN